MDSFKADPNAVSFTSTNDLVSTAVQLNVHGVDDQGDISILPTLTLTVNLEILKSTFAIRYHPSSQDASPDHTLILGSSSALPSYYIEERRPEAFKLLMAIAHQKWELVPPFLDIEDLFNLAVMAEKHCMTSYLKGAVSSLLSNYVRQVVQTEGGLTKESLLPKSSHWLVVSWLWGMTGVFQLVLPEVVLLAEHDLNGNQTLELIQEVSTEVFLVGELKDMISRLRKEEISKYYHFLSIFHAQLQDATRKCPGAGICENHNGDKCQALMLGSMMRSKNHIVDSLRKHGWEATQHYHGTAKDLIEAVEEIASGLLMLDDVSILTCNTLFQDVCRESGNVGGAVFLGDEVHSQLRTRATIVGLSEGWMARFEASFQ